jgi:ornithine carbamoyltransferase
MPSLISLADLTEAQVRELVEDSARLTLERDQSPLRGRIVGVYFALTSTRTRTAFTTGILRLGGHAIAYGPADLQLATGETVNDTAMVLAGMLDALVVRAVCTTADLRDYAEPGLPVINAMSTDEHPTQALADLLTIKQHLGDPAGARVVYFGEGNSSAAALALGLGCFEGARLDLVTPAGYGVPASTIAVAAERFAANGGRLRQYNSLDELPDEADVVYTTQWATTGTVKADPDWLAAFRPYQVNEPLLKRWPKAAVMHDLPARRGDEITAETLEGPRSLVRQQAHNKLWTAMAALRWTVSDH